jgi:hypothetical protein
LANIKFLVLLLTIKFDICGDKMGQNVTGKSGCFLAPESDEFLKNSGILKIKKWD